jgi:hypothetical protein
MQVTRITTPMTKILSEKYIAYYCSLREKGEAPPRSLSRARSILQEYVIQLMIENPKGIGEIGTAYENIKLDDTLRERAIIIYDLSQCEDSIKNKYMPLLSQ